MNFRVRVCFCGRPVPPNTPPMPGHRAEAAILSFIAAIARSVEYVASLSLPAAAERLKADLTPKREFEDLDCQLELHERWVNRWLRRFDPASLEGKRKSWHRVVRAASSAGIDFLVLGLQKKAGLTFDKAREAARAVFTIWSQALARGEAVETPLGTLSVRPAPKSRPRFRFGKKQNTFAYSRRLWFRPAVAFKVRAKRNRPEEESFVSTPADVEVPAVQCPHCGGIWFSEGVFNQYRRNEYAAFPGGDLQPIWEDGVPFRICLCGAPIEPERHKLLGTRQKRINSALDSLGRAQVYLRRLRDIDQAMAELRQELVSRHATGKLHRRMDAISESLETLRSIIMSRRKQA